MTVQALLSRPVVQTMSPAEAFALLKQTAAVKQVKQRVTSRVGSPMLGCFADLVEFDATLNTSAVKQVN